MNTIEYRVDCALLKFLHHENALGCRFPIGKTTQVSLLYILHLKFATYIPYSRKEDCFLCRLNFQESYIIASIRHILPGRSLSWR